MSMVYDDQNSGFSQGGVPIAPTTTTLHFGSLFSTVLDSGGSMVINPGGAVASGIGRLYDLSTDSTTAAQLDYDLTFLQYTIAAANGFPLYTPQLVTD